MADLTPEQLHAVPGGHPKANTIAFEIWHLVRTEDNVVRFVIQNRRPTIWAEGKYAERFREGTNLVLLAPDVAEAFPTAESVNEALRLVLQLTELRTKKRMSSAKR